MEIIEELSKNTKIWSKNGVIESHRIMAMKLDLKDKVILVTGSSGGIGHGIAKLLIKEGANVILNGRNLDALQKAYRGSGAFNFFRADVTKLEEADALIKKVVDECGRLDGLVCNVGSGSSVAPGEETLIEWKRVLEINLFSTTNMVEASKNAIAKARGSIVCISSICGLQVIPNAPVTYSASKAALNAYVKGISRPLGKLGVRINAIAPGNIFFEGSVWQKKMSQSHKSVSEILDKSVALRTLGQPEDVASLCAYLLSPKSKFMTGSILTVDGGQIQ